MLNFYEATDRLAKSRNKNDAPLENNTRLIRIDDDTIGVRLHDTYVVKIHRNGTYTLNSGGWQTSTTKDRINGYAPRGIYSVKGAWWIGVYLGNGEHVRIMPFEDGARVDAKGIPIGVRLLRYEVLAIDVWGNSKDGYELNDQHGTGKFFTIADKTSDEDALIALRDALGHKRTAKGYYSDNSDEYNLYFNTNKDHKPAYYARLVIDEENEEIERGIKLAEDAAEGE